MPPPFEQPPIGIPPVGLGPGMPSPMPMINQLFGGIANLASRMPVETVSDKIRKALDILEEVRSKDSKQAPNIGMAIHVLTQGPEGLDRFNSDTSNKETRRDY